MHIALDVEIAAAGERALADESGAAAVVFALGILGAVDEARQVAAVAVAEAVNVLDDTHGLAELRAHATGRLEAQIEAVAADMQEQIRRRRRRHAAIVGECLKRRQTVGPAAGV